MIADPDALSAYDQLNGRTVGRCNRPKIFGNTGKTMPGVQHRH